MKNIIKFISIIFFLPFAAQAQDYSQVRRHSNVWVNECEFCHKSYKDLAEKVGIQTEQYMFNVVYYHENEEGRIFGTILSKTEIDFVARFILIEAYLHKLEKDVRKAGDLLHNNIIL